MLTMLPFAQLNSHIGPIRAKLVSDSASVNALLARDTMHSETGLNVKLLCSVHWQIQSDLHRKGCLHSIDSKNRTSYTNAVEYFSLCGVYHLLHRVCVVFMTVAKLWLCCVYKLYKMCMLCLCIQLGLNYSSRK